MPRGFLMWMEFHPILVGAGCLVVGYVFGRHGKAFSEVQAHLSSSSENRLHAQSQRISHLEELRCCKCCTSVSTELGSAATCNSRGYNLTKRETLNVADETEQLQRTTKRDHGRVNLMDCDPHHMMLNERLLQPKTPCKKQKSTQMGNEPLCSKAKSDMDYAFELQSIPIEGDADDDDNPAAFEPWSQEVLNKRIEYFNYVTSASQTPERGSPDGYRDLMQHNKTFLKVGSGAKGKVSDCSNSLNSPKSTYNSGGTVRSPSICGLVPLATPNHVDYSGENSPNSPNGNSVSECTVSKIGVASASPQIGQTLINPKGLYKAAGNSSDACEDNSGDAERDAVVALPHSVSDPNEGIDNEVKSTIGITPLSVAGCQSASNVVHVELPQSPSTSRNSGESEMTTETLADKLVQGKICPQLNETDCSKKKSSKRNPMKSKSSSFVSFLKFWRKHPQGSIYDSQAG
ncbi:uncharacterized protein [Physcomitrium patens]|uniref:uncharacterized protein isoform X2 n=1 Tax=Physcomitrium patens TaxID=3218 RepID=UPI000D15A80D|nr:uncharacterized protein LOC112277821 isoform X2 [Physcomitrium patens]|eukprot:XP_024366343.1 uncharacterized protein LOC112277821 isoform X2 [Physcomitrella patens]